MFDVFDLHNDFYTELKDDKKREKYVLENANIAKHIVSAVWTSKLDRAQAMDIISKARDFSNSHQNLFLGVEDLHFLGKDCLNEFYSFRPLYSGLTWNNTNCLAGGAHESGGLTIFGRQVLRGLEMIGTKIDTAHLNEDSFMDISKVSSKPLFCSHTACFGVNPHKRNLKDYQIKMIVDSGGILGLCLVSDFLNGQKTCKVEDIVAHIDYFACKFGVNNLALGTDFYGTKHLPHGINNYLSLKKQLSAALIRLGYTEKSINKIFFENAETFFQK